MPLTLEDFDYPLPPELIAQFPAPERAASRLLRLSGAALSDHRFSELAQFLRPDDVLVFNDTRVIKARLHGVKASGGKIEALIERITGPHEALVQLRASHPPRPGARLCFDAALEAEVAVLATDLEEALAAGDTAGQIRSLGLLGDRYRALGRLGQAVSRLREAVRLATAAGDDSRLVANLIRLGTAWQYAGEYTVAESTLRQGLDNAEKLGLRDMVGFAFQHLGKCLAEQGRYPEAHGCFLAALEVRRSLGDPGLLDSTREALAELTSRQASAGGGP